MSQSHQPAQARETVVAIPTYGVGQPDRNPMFLEKRVYQGSSGRVYPHPVIDKIEDQKMLKDYTMLILENDYLRVEIMPELGGRIYRAVDKTNNYDFVYYNQVIKPALVGLAGPWISGGIEFNWPQHHRPNTFGPVEYKLEQGEEGTATVWISEIDRMYGTKVTAGFTLHPDKAYLEINAQLYNRTAQSQTFLWWANPAVAVNDHTQSVFPPDVNAVFDHGKRDVSRFPIATGTYYKMDYSEGVDISRYKNIPVPTSYMAYKSDYNFVGGYDHAVGAGLLHVANHHISPGKKQWTWGNGEFGQAWDRALTDEDGPYIELMTGVYTDNQPDFTWLQPYEEKSFTQYFMPYKGVGVVKNATIDAAVNLEISEDGSKAAVHVYVTSDRAAAVISLTHRGEALLRRNSHLSPQTVFSEEIGLPEGVESHELEVAVCDSEGRTMVRYRTAAPSIEEVPDAAKPLPQPEELKTQEELYLAGLHLEQYRHATFEPEAYYLEGLKRDPQDSRINVAYGTLLLRRGLWEAAEACFRQAISRLTWRNPNPYNSEAYYQLGMALKYQDRLEEAFTALYKAVWSADWQDAGYYSLAQIAASRSAYEEALELVDRGLIRNAHNYKARHLRAALLRLAGDPEAAAAYARLTLELDKADFGAAWELALSLQIAGDEEEAGAVRTELERLMRGDVHNYLALASDYASAGLYREAVSVLEPVVSAQDHHADYPMVHYVRAFCLNHLDETKEAVESVRTGSAANPDYCFPNTLFDLQVLEHAALLQPEDARAPYFLGNLYYDRKRCEDAISAWERSAAADPSLATVHRNLSLAYYNKRQEAERALDALELAFRCDPADARVAYELDQLRKKLGHPAEERLAFLAGHLELVEARDDLYLEYVTLHNTLNRYEEARQLLARRTFHPWEGGEGKTLGQYVLAHVELAQQELDAQRYGEAEELLLQALHNPVNLGEAKLAGAQENNVYYYLGCALAAQGREQEAGTAFRRASQGLDEPASAMYYNDQPPEMIFYQGLAWEKLGDPKEANKRFNKLIDYAEKHLFDDVKIDYFAVSLPDFLVFDEDLNKRNVIHCRFMRGLGLLGLQRPQEAGAEFDTVLALDSGHQGAAIHQRQASSKEEG